MARRVATAVFGVAVATVLGVGIAAVVAVFRAGSITETFTPVLWLIGAASQVISLRTPREGGSLSARAVGLPGVPRPLAVRSSLGP